MLNLKFHTCISRQLVYPVCTLLMYVCTMNLQASESELPSISQQVEKFQEQMKNNKDAPKVSEQDMVVMQKAQQELARILPNPGLNPGSKAPDFKLQDAFGRQVSLYQELKKGPVILVFYRGAWCPFCNIQLHALQQSLPEFKKYGASLIAITPQQPDKSREQIEKDKYPFLILSDLDDVASKSYNLFFRIDPKLHELYKTRFGLDIEAYNGKGRLWLPVPGSFVISQQGTIVAMHADLDYKKRMEPIDIVRALKEIK